MVELLNNLVLMGQGMIELVKNLAIYGGGGAGSLLLVAGIFKFIRKL